MAWTPPTARLTGDLITASIWNTDIVNNLLAAFPAGVAYTSYVPVLTASTSNPTLGSGSSQTGYYLQVGKLVHCWGQIVFGTSGTATGSGTYRISLPITPSLGQDVYGSVFLYDSSANNMCAPVPRNAPSNGYFTMQYPAAAPIGALTDVTHGTPWAWSASDQLNWNVTYNVA